MKMLMSGNKTSKTIENCYLVAAGYAVLFGIILVLGNSAFADRLLFLYAANSLGMSLLFFSFPYSVKQIHGADHTLALLLRGAALACFVGATVWLIVVTVQWYLGTLDFHFHLGGLIIYLAGLVLSILVLFGKAFRIGKELRKNVARINKTAMRNFMAGSLLLAYLQLSLLIELDFVTHFVGALAFAIILLDQSVNVTRWFIREVRG